MAKAERDYIIPPTDNAVFPAMPPARLGVLPRKPDEIELLAVIATAIAAADRADAILAAVDHLPVNDQRHATALSQARDCMRPYHTAVARAAATPVTTMLGMKAKAALCLRRYRHDANGFDLARSLMHDILAAED
jgi:hypothetical protein